MVAITTRSMVLADFMVAVRGGTFAMVNGRLQAYSLGLSTTNGTYVLVQNAEGGEWELLLITDMK